FRRADHEIRALFAERQVRVPPVYIRGRREHGLYIQAAGKLERLFCALIIDLERIDSFTVAGDLKSCQMNNRVESAVEIGESLGEGDVALQKSKPLVRLELGDIVQGSHRKVVDAYDLVSV